MEHLQTRGQPAGLTPGEGEREYGGPQTSLAPKSLCQPVRELHEPLCWSIVGQSVASGQILGGS